MYTMSHAISRKALVLGVFSMLLGMGRAEAGFNVSLGTTSLVNTDTQFNYTASVAQGDQIVAGNSFTIQNFGGYESGSITAPSSWTAATTANVANGTASDLTFTYNGATALAGPTAISGFSANSVFAGTQGGYFMATNDSASAGVDSIRSVGGVLVPNSGLVSPAPAPEPSSLVLGAIGIVGFGIVHVRRRRNAS